MRQSASVLHILKNTLTKRTCSVPVGEVASLVVFKKENDVLWVSPATYVFLVERGTLF